MPLPPIQSGSSNIVFSARPQHTTFGKKYTYTLPDWMFQELSQDQQKEVKQGKMVELTGLTRSHKDVVPEFWEAATQRSVEGDGYFHLVDGKPMLSILTDEEGSHRSVFKLLLGLMADHSRSEKIVKRFYQTLLNPIDEMGEKFNELSKMDTNQFFQDVLAYVTKKAEEKAKLN